MTMAATRSVQAELADLKKELAGLRSDYVRLKSRGAATKWDGAQRFGAIRDDVSERIGALKDKIADGTGATVDDISRHLEDLREIVSEYSDKSEKTVASHPIAAVAGALAVGYLIGRLSP
jgi:hypothetical protein